ncbi:MULTISPECIES: DMT family transporter [Lysinibacillus]|uniref:DMT family transporter n=1 Tax=Lysinibacillus TaxID=400634 RepID=UPI00088E9690|nr:MULTISPECIES: DMT family transporter [unclassified Lysinibacillus]MEE3809605.1 DMT family transporter [Lysinibacillus fusiformis]SCY08913.1 EamA domain-containing membrane protein RarD [Lysinibacillus sp. SG9]SDB13226.1 EamA domain-containing membrane protein RarD [Lysinibacillus sp. TC-37]SFS51392.1 EamA domain-containing membrane protein RarD [Lysinibacillus sp. SG55]
MRNKGIGAIFLSLAASIWGAMYVVVKVVVEVVPPLELVWIRYLIAVIALGIIGIVMKQSWTIAKKDWLIIFLVGLIGNTISIVTQEMGTMLSTAQMGAMITATTPAFMVVFARFILQENITIKKCLSIVLATIGVGIIVGNAQIDITQQLGGFYLLIAALTWAFMSALVKKVPSHYSQIVVTTYSSIVAVILLTPFILPRLKDLALTTILQPTISGGLLYLGIVSTAGGFLLWNKGLQLMNASSGGLFFFFQPIVGTFLGWLLLGETIGLSFWLGSLFILSGVFIVIRDE